MSYVPRSGWYKRLEAAGHKLKLDDDGTVDSFALDYEHHNGPMCVLCDEMWCEHCRDEIKPCPCKK
jgi:hypothetical protein